MPAGQPRFMLSEIAFGVYGGCLFGASCIASIVAIGGNPPGLLAVAFWCVTLLLIAFPVAGLLAVTIGAVVETVLDAVPRSSVAIRAAAVAALYLLAGYGVGLLVSVIVPVGIAPSVVALSALVGRTVAALDRAARTATPDGRVLTFVRQATERREMAGTPGSSA